jgi:Uri superfamily endonuclease
MGQGEQAENSGAYRLFIRLARNATIVAGRLGTVELPRGLYVYVGSARRGLAQRVARHQRLARSKTGKCHWHIDRLLIHAGARLEGVELAPGGEECALSKRIADAPGVGVPVPGFGATDCRQGCPAHLYRLPATTDRAR